MYYDSDFFIDCQSSVLRDVSGTGRVRPWREHKMGNMLLAAAYDAVDERKAARLRECASLLVYQPQADGSKRLVSANFCRVRLCPICAWRRSLKVYGQMQSILDRIALFGKSYCYIMLTLTMRSVGGLDLSGALNELLEGYRRLMMYAPVKRAVKGAYRGLEVTHNVDHNSDSYDTYHPHLHVLLCVNRSYFDDRKRYISHQRWCEMWQRALGVDYVPVVHVQRCKGSTAASISEVAKYAVKSADYIIPDDWDLTVDAVRILDSALDHRRLVSFSGIFRTVARELRLDDVVDGDLLHVGDGVAEDDPLRQYIYYVWHTGYSQYVQD